MKEGKDFNNAITKEIMRVNPIAINQNKDIEETVSIPDRNGIFMTSLVEDVRRVIGICPRYDIIKEILNERSVIIGKKNATTTVGKG